MKNSFLLTLILLLTTLYSVSGQQEARLLRFPATNGTDVVFSYAGDLYKVPLSGGEAVRLTSHVGYEIFPRFSPDGKTIAFTGEYDGNKEIYTIPADGGEPSRITYTTSNGQENRALSMGSNNLVMGWTPDGKNIVYNNNSQKGFGSRLYYVSIEGGLSKELPLSEGGFCSYSPDGSKLAFNRMFREFRTWKYYTGGQADEVWIYDFKAGAVSKITDNVYQDIIPMWVGDNIFYLSDRDRTMNMFVYDTDSKQTTKVTHFDDFDIKFPSAHGNTIVFENAGYLYKMDAIERRPEKIAITLASDNRYARPGIKSAGNYVRGASLSPDGKRLGITARGEIFDVPVTKGVTRNVTRTPGAHERYVRWSPDGKYIAYISDRTGETEIWLYNVKSGKEIQLTKKNDTYIWSIEWSPDSKSIVYTDRKNRLVLVNLDSKKKRVIIEDPVWVPKDPTFSADSKWLAYTRMADNDFDIVYIYNISEKKEYPITDKWYDSGQPIFSTDGKYLFFNSDRTFSPSFGSTEMDYITESETSLYMALLSKDTPSPFLNKDPEVNAKVEEKKDKNSLKFDPDGIADRILNVPIGTYTGSPVYSDGKKVYYNTRFSTWMYDLAAQDDSELVGATMSLTPGSKKALFFSNGRYYVSDIPQMRKTLGTSVSFADMKVTPDYEKEWRQIFDEAWRMYRDGFYVANMHGVDWPAMKKKYEVFLPYVKNRIDLNYVIGEMLAELNVGHCYVTAPSDIDQANITPIGMLGAEIARHKSGFFRIEKILEGKTWNKNMRSPLAEPGIQVKNGDYIVAIDGVATNTTKDIYSLLRGKSGVRTELSVNKNPKLKGARKVVVIPLSNERRLYYNEWIEQHIQKVEKATNGRVGYIYIPDMGSQGLTEFARFFYSQLEKEALIIDVRYNGGGYVSPMILERLSREAYRLTQYRGTNRIMTVPDGTQTGPKVCLINKHAGSDGDLFPWGFKRLGLGKLIGTRTWGGIVGITNSLPFIDGTSITVPLSTSYDPKTGDWIIENHGVDPDIWVDNDPSLEFKGIDQQLDRAIEEVMKELENRKEFPPVPAPRVWSK